MTTRQIAFDPNKATPGALIASDGRFSPVNMRIRPDPSTLYPPGRWTAPAELLKQLPTGHYLELSDCDVRQSQLKPAPALGTARSTWKVVLLTTHAADEKFALQIQYISGPGLTKRAVVRWDGVEIKSFDSTSTQWELRSESVEIPNAQKSRHVLEIADDDKDPTNSNANPQSLLLTGLAFSRDIQIVGQSIQCKSPSGQLILLATPVPSAPVRLWTIGYGNGASSEFLAHDQVCISEPAEAHPMRDGYDAGLHHVRFPIERNADGSQVDDFRKAVCLIASEASGRLEQAISFTVEFDSPVTGDATLVGRLVARGPWRITCNDHAQEIAAQPAMKTIAVPSLPISAGKNKITFESLQGEMRWDWIGLNLNDPSPLMTAPSAEGWPLAPLVPSTLSNEIIHVDPRVRWSFENHHLVQANLFGITMHNGLDVVNKVPAFREYFTACRFAACKGADCILSAAPQHPQVTPEEMTAYFNSKQPLKQYLASYWNFSELLIPKTAQGLGLDWCMIGSGLPRWMLMPPATDWNLPPNDPQQAAQVVVGCINMVRPSWPELRNIYVWNEPDAGWWRANNTIKKTFGVDYGTYFRQYLSVLSKAIRAAYPEMRIAAPSTLDVPLSSAARESLNDRWLVWFEPLVRESWNDFDQFDFHFYGRDTREILANFQAIEAASMTLHGQTKPIIITESNCSDSVSEGNNDPRLALEAWHGRALPYAQFLVAMASQPHRLQENLCHDLLAGDYGIFIHGGYEPTPSAQIFHFLAPVRGMILGGNSLNPDFTWIATREANQLTIAVVTSPRNGGKISVELPLPDGVSFTVGQLSLNASTGLVLERKLPPVAMRKGHLELPAMPASMILLQTELKQDVPIASEIRVTETFAAGFVQALDTRTPSIKWELKSHDRVKGARYLVRIATVPADAIDRVKLSWNGTSLPIQGRFVTDVALKPNDVLDTNQVAISLADTKSLRAVTIASVSLIQIQEPVSISTQSASK